MEQMYFILAGTFITVTLCLTHYPVYFSVSPLLTFIKLKFCTHNIIYISYIIE